MFRTRRATLNPGERLASPSLPHQQRHSRAAGSCSDQHAPFAGRAFNGSFWVRGAAKLAAGVDQCRSFLGRRLNVRVRRNWSLACNLRKFVHYGRPRACQLTIGRQQADQAYIDVAAADHEVALRQPSGLAESRSSRGPARVGEVSISSSRGSGSLQKRKLSPHIFCKSPSASETQYRALRISCCFAPGAMSSNPYLCDKSEMLRNEHGAGHVGSIE